MKTLRLLAVPAALVLVAGLMMTSHSRPAGADEAGKVLKHVVMYKFKDECTAADVQAVVDAFGGLPKKVDTIIGYEAGVNVSEEGKSEGLTHCFVVTFKNKDGLATYLKHPAHDAYVQVVKNRREKVVVFDYWADAAK